MEDAAIRSSLIRQYGATLAMLRSAIELCPEELWFDARYKNPYWQIVYHTLFYAHFYVQWSEQHFERWPKHRDGARQLGNLPAQELAKIASTKAEMLEYHELCAAEAAARLAETQLEAASGFSWLPFTKLELHLYNLRHIQHNTGQLADRLRVACDVGVPWVGKV